MKVIKVSFKVLIALLAFVVLIILGTNFWVLHSTDSQIYSNIDQIPETEIALVLGTSHRLINGSPNPYFKERMQLAANLYHEEKVKHILVSGDNATKYYNEPIVMKNALIELGVPEEVITLDYAGFRTLDSIIRCKKVFDQNDITIITQSFHSYRALFISDYYNMKSVAMVNYSGPDIPKGMIFREYLARTLAVFDLYIINREPKFLGKKETLNG